MDPGFRLLGVDALQELRSQAVDELLTAVQRDAPPGVLREIASLVERVDARLEQRIGDTFESRQRIAATRSPTSHRGT